MDANTFLIGFGMLVGAIVYWRKGGNKASNEANTALLQLNETSRLQMDTMKASIKGLEDREREQGKEIGRLQGILSEKEKQIAILAATPSAKKEFTERGHRKEPATHECVDGDKGFHA